MEDKFLKYGKLYLLIFLMFLSVPVIFAILIGAFYGLSKVISSSPVDVLFQLLIISMPAAVFCTAYTIFFKRTLKHPSPPVRILSMILFTTGFVCCLVFLTLDIIFFFHKHVGDISLLRCFGVFFLGGNIGGLFLIAIIQALTTEKERDWLQKRREKDPGYLN